MAGCPSLRLHIHMQTFHSADRRRSPGVPGAELQPRLNADYRAAIRVQDQNINFIQPSQYSSEGQYSSMATAG